MRYASSSVIRSRASSLSGRSRDITVVLDIDRNGPLVIQTTIKAKSATPSRSMKRFIMDRDYVMTRGRKTDLAVRSSAFRLRF